MALKFINITKENILLATELELKIFPNMCAYNSYKNAYEKGAPYWLVYNNDSLIGISGLYEYPELGEPKTVWLGWYGILDQFRGNGYGKEILLKTIKIAKEKGYETLRLYTSKKLCPTAMNLYEKIMDFGEPYTLEQIDLERYVFTKSLSNKPATKWNNRNLYLYLDEESEKEGLEIYLKLKNN